MRRIFIMLLVMLLAQFPLYASRIDQAERLENSADVLSEIMRIPEDSIPKDLLEKAECVVIIPGAKKGAFGIGGTYGKGCMICRQGDQWSPPVMMLLTGGSYGLQIGGVETDYVLLIMNPKGRDKLLQSKVTLGGDASVAGGPKGRTATAATDVQMRAEILSYARSRGLFAGASLSGAVLKPDSGDNEDLYGTRIDPKRILTRSETVPPEADRLISLLEDYSPHS